MRPANMWLKPFLRLRLRRLTGCYVPRWLLIVATLVVAPMAHGDFEWFEGDWVSDNKTTMVGEDWELMKSKFPEEYEKIENLFEHTKWHVRDGIIVISRLDVPDFSSSYSYRPGPMGTIEIFGESGAVFSVRRTRAGFCAEFSKDSSLAKECFKVAGT